MGARADVADAPVICYRMSRLLDLSLSIQNFLITASSIPKHDPDARTPYTSDRGYSSSWDMISGRVLRVHKAKQRGVRFR